VKKISSSAFKKVRLEKEMRENEIIKKNTEFGFFILIKSSNPTSVSIVSIDTTSLQERE